MIWLHQIDPVALSLGPVSIHWYGLAYAVAFVMAWLLGRRRIAAGRLPGVNMEGLSDLAFYGMIGVVLGGRIGSILFYSFGEFLQNPLVLLRIWEGGMSFHGGLLGVMVAAWWWTRKRGIHYFDTMDFVAPLIPAGLGIGRVANFVGAELWGKYTQAGWGVVFPSGLPDALRGLDAATLRAQYESGALDAYARHPSQLYQAFLEGVLLFGLLWWFSSKPRPRYAVSGMFALLYGVFRFAVEFVRMPDADIGYLAFGWLTMGQVLSVPLIVLGLFMLWLSRRSPTLQPVVPIAPEAHATKAKP